MENKLHCYRKLFKKFPLESDKNLHLSSVFLFMMKNIGFNVLNKEESSSNVDLICFFSLILKTFF